MYAYYTSHARRNPLVAPITLRFAVALSAISESEGSASEQGNHYLNSPIYQDTGCNLFHSCLSCPLSACKDGLHPNDPRRELRLLQNFRYDHSPQQLRNLPAPPRNPRARGIGSK